ncbi:MAG TPA: co-chaperone GroES [Bacteroidales bacterium]|nr:co-chaperone GroES [Bacteroidales bacterium]
MSEINIKPLGKRIVIAQQEAEQRTAGGIIIPGSAQEKPLQGKVLAIGSSKDIEVKVGDLVIYGKYKGTMVTLEGKEYLILDQDDVLAVI